MEKDCGVDQLNAKKEQNIYILILCQLENLNTTVAIKSASKLDSKEAKTSFKVKLLSW